MDLRLLCRDFVVLDGSFFVAGRQIETSHIKLHSVRYGGEPGRSKNLLFRVGNALIRYVPMVK
jgi:hypothetical protein